MEGARALSGCGCLATVDLVRSIARYRQELDAELNALQEDQAEGV